ncbi:nucleotidyltransferase domain-containing protein [Dyadobacter subterraneus]|uniref:Nucleotidyltransferase domain-containing protein n=1 Tax=Dyadobacter subterraneus TaxID=2773304 RepID=A0ABR9W4A7_9BACT|nr:nucleotidyltransferase domain-containing protein [Dyadobacter subterraneus]MBE9460288.1 nucleotidyltransferase domain-containing protein [Dyadobacter subterraneus]
MSNRKVPESVARLTEEFVNQMGQLYGDRLDKVILYGSYARGDQHEDSDIDYLVVLNDEEIKTFKEISNLSPVTFELSLQYSISVSAIPVTQSSFNQNWSPLYQNVHEDGIML